MSPPVAASIYRGCSLMGHAVLNISGCGLKKLPVALKSLTKLKAIVAMNNEWTELDEGVVGAWSDLNSLSMSFKPFLFSLYINLTSIHSCFSLSQSGVPPLNVIGPSSSFKAHILALPSSFRFCPSKSIVTSLTARCQDEQSPQLDRPSFTRFFLG